MPISKTLSYQPSQGTLGCSQMRSWDIVVPPEAIPSEKYAAEEFQRWFGKATGIELPLRSAAQGRTDHVYIDPDIAPLDSATMGEEELQIIVESDRVVIVGGRPRGTLYGVYQFLEDFIGVRFLTHDHAHIPPIQTLVKGLIPAHAEYWQILRAI
jgi:hypothetical protein